MTSIGRLATSMKTDNQRIRVILNGKSSGNIDVRSAVGKVRELGHQVEVRVTWEFGDAARYAADAVRDEVDVVVAAGGDGTVNEVVAGLMATDSPKLPVAESSRFGVPLAIFWLSLIEPSWLSSNKWTEPPSSPAAPTTKSGTRSPSRSPTATELPK